MKTSTMFNPKGKTISGILIIMALFAFTSCAEKMIFLNSAVVPAAEGKVSVKSDKNKNYVVQVNVSNLAEVARLQPSKQTYVVWMVTSQNNTENLGQLKSSKKLNASFKTVTSSKPIKIFVTAENDGSVQYPGEQVVLTTNAN